MQRNDLLNELAKRILAIHRPHPTRVAFDGVDAAGKTSLAEALAAFLPNLTHRQVIRAGIDRFHNPREVRYRQGPDSPDGYYEDSFDLAALRRKLLDPLGPGGDRNIQTTLFDFRSDAPLPGETMQAARDAILLFDGVFLLRPELADCWDFTVFVQVSFETVLTRVIVRDRELLGGEENVLRRYRQRYIPAQRRYLEACRPAERADVVVGNDDLQAPVILNR